MQQYYGGIRIRNGSVISHVDPNGNYTYTDSIKRNINIDLMPAVAEAEVLDVVAKQPGHHAPYSSPPQAEIVIYPVIEAVDAVPLIRGNESDLDTNRSATKVKEYRLAYEIRTVEGTEFSSQSANAWMYFVDAQNGQLLESYSLTHASVGTGSGAFNKKVSFTTSPGLAGFQMIDPFRNFSTSDADSGPFSSVRPV